jgi:hypothetical protein
MELFFEKQMKNNSVHQIGVWFKWIENGGTNDGRSRVAFSRRGTKTRDQHHLSGGYATRGDVARNVSTNRAEGFFAAVEDLPAEILQQGNGGLFNQGVFRVISVHSVYFIPNWL